LKPENYPPRTRRLVLTTPLLAFFFKQQHRNYRVATTAGTSKWTQRQASSDNKRHISKAQVACQSLASDGVNQVHQNAAQSKVTPGQCPGCSKLLPGADQSRLS